MGERIICNMRKKNKERPDIFEYFTQNIHTYESKMQSVKSAQNDNAF